MFILDLAFKDYGVKNEEAIHDNDKVSDLLAMRVKRFHKTNLFKV